MKSIGLPWRAAFLGSALCIAIGGPRHPGGSMAEMLAHPDWVPAHAFLLAGFVALLIGLVLFQRTPSLPRGTRTWLRFAVIATALQAVEMAFHLAAVVDQANLVAGRSTPVLSTHLGLAVVIYPVFALAWVGLIIAGMRDHVLGSRWIGWIGMLGVLGQGVSPPLIVLLHVEQARVLFPLLAVFALWILLAAFWPLAAAGGKKLE